MLASPTGALTVAALSVLHGFLFFSGLAHPIWPRRLRALLRHTVSFSFSGSESAVEALLLILDREEGQELEDMEGDGGGETCWKTTLFEDLDGDGGGETRRKTTLEAP